MFKKKSASERYTTAFSSTLVYISTEEMLFLVSFEVSRAIYIYILNDDAKREQNSI